MPMSDLLSASCTDSLGLGLDGEGGEGAMFRANSATHYLEVVEAKQG